MNKLVVGENGLTYNGINWFASVPHSINLWVFQSGQEPPFSETVYSEQDTESFCRVVESIPMGYPVAVTISASTIVSDSVKNACSSLGASQVYDLTSPTSTFYTLIGAKGQVMGSAIEGKGVDISSQLDNIPSTSILTLSVSNDTASVKVNHLPIAFDYVCGLNMLVFTSNLRLLSIRSFNTIEDTIQNAEFIESLNDQNLMSDTLVVVIARVPADQTGASLALTPAAKDCILTKLGSRYLDRFLLTNENVWFVVSQCTSARCESSGLQSSICSASYFPFNGTLVQHADMSAGSTGRMFGSSANCYDNQGHKITVSDTFLFTMSIFNELDNTSIQEFDIVANDSPEVNSNVLTLKQASNYIQTSISLGSAVVVCSCHLPDGFVMPSDFSAALKTLGANLTHRITDTSSYSLIGRRGCAPGSVPEIQSNSGPVSIFSYFNSPIMAVKPFLDITACEFTPNPVARFYINSQLVEYEASRGINVMVINPENAKIIFMDTYDTCADVQASNDFAIMMNNLANGMVVALACMDDFTWKLNDNARNAILNKMGGVVYGYYPMQLRSSYSVIGVVGKQIYPSQSFSNGPNARPAISAYRMPITMVYTPGISYLSITSNIVGIIVNGAKVGQTIDSVSYCAILPNLTEPISPAPLISGHGHTLLQNITSLPSGAIVVISISTHLPLNNSYRLALKLICASSYDLAMESNSSNYLVVGRRGTSCGSALEHFSIDSSPVSLSTLEPIFPNTAPVAHRSGMSDVMSFSIPAFFVVNGWVREHLKTDKIGYFPSSSLNQPPVDCSVVGGCNFYNNSIWIGGKAPYSDKPVVVNASINYDYSIYPTKQVIYINTPNHVAMNLNVSGNIDIEVDDVTEYDDGLNIESLTINDITMI
eukprot:gene7909-9285_t